MPRTYEKRFGLLRDPAVNEEIDRLDARRDCQRIAHLLAAYEFPWDFPRSLEIALFYTYGSASVAKLLDRTGEFHDNGQKRYDDTRLLMTHIIHSGWDGDFGRRALERMNRSHGHYRIANDDFLFVLWTFIDFPIRWTEAYAHRPMTAHERLAWFHFWVGVGERMQLTAIPESKEAFDRWVDAYMAEHFVPNAASARVAADTVRILEGWLPTVARGPVGPVVHAFFDDDPRFLAAIGVSKPPAYVRPLVEKALGVIGRAKRELALGPYPTRPDDPKNRTYGSAPPRIEDLRPAKLAAKEDGAARTRA